jgi:purine-binding chemotaxis protein CheW
MPERFLTFRANGQLYALPAEQVSEVIRMPAVARVQAGVAWPRQLARQRCRRQRARLGGAKDRPRRRRGRSSSTDGAGGAGRRRRQTLVAVETDQIETRQAELAARPGERLKGAFAADGRNTTARSSTSEGLIGAAFVWEARAGRGARGPAPRWRKGDAGGLPATTGRCW